MKQLLDPEMQALMRLPLFRKFLLHIHAAAGITIPANGADPSLLSYREGRRSLGLEIFSLAARGLPRGSGADEVLGIVLSETHPKETADDAEGQSESIDRR